MWDKSSIEHDWGVTLAPYQARFLWDARPGRYRILSLSMGRGGGKTWLAGLISALELVSEDNPEAELYLLGSGQRNARIALGDTLRFLEGRFGDLTPDNGWAVVNNSAKAQITNLRTGVTLQALGSDSRRLMGHRSKTTILDEPAQLPPQQGEALFAALSTSLGKIDGARLILTGTSPRSEWHWWHDVLNSKDRDVKNHIYKADPESDKPFGWRNIRKANPGLDWDWPSRAQLDFERRESIKHSTSSMAGNFEAYRLNLGAEEVLLGEPLLSAQVWREIRARPVAREQGRLGFGLDLGGTRSLSSVSVWAPDSVAPDGSRSPLLTNYCAVGGTPDPRTRGSEDGVGELYVQAQREGSLLVFDGQRIPDVAALLWYVIQRHGMPEYLVSDLYRRGEVLQVVEQVAEAMPAGAGDTLLEHTFFLHGGSKAGAECVARFRKIFLDEPVSVVPSRLLDQAILACRLRRSYEGSLILASNWTKRQRRVKDDAAAASLYVAGCQVLMDWEHGVAEL